MLNVLPLSVRFKRIESSKGSIQTLVCLILLNVHVNAWAVDQCCSTVAIFARSLVPGLMHKICLVVHFLEYLYERKSGT